MLESALNLTLPDKIDWGRALFDADQAALTTVNVASALDIIPNTVGVDEDDSSQLLKYAKRDRQLAYRDVVVASALSKAAIKLSTIWNIDQASLPRIPLDYHVEPELKHHSADDPHLDASYAQHNLPPQLTRGEVVHVKNSSVPKDALFTDKMLANRDNLIYQATAMKCLEVIDQDKRGLVVNLRCNELPLVDTASPANNPTNTGVTVDDEEQAAVFNGTSSNLVTTGLPLGTSVFTIELWLKVGTYAAGTTKTVLSLGDATATPLVVTQNGTGQLFVTGVAGPVDATDTLNFGTEWNHLAITYENGALKCYRNGLLIKTASTTLVLAGVGLTVAKAGSTYWPGMIHNLRVWNVARTATEIFKTYKSHLAFSSPLDLLEGYTIFNISTIWMQGEGEENNAEVHPSLPLNRDLFKKPDQNLAQRDNYNAAYAARILEVLQNPFRYAQRLAVEISKSTDDATNRKAENYILFYDDPNQRIWVAEPALPGRTRLVYNKTNHSLRWIMEDTNQLHVEQPVYGLEIKGVLADQKIKVIPQTLAPSNPNFWREKARLINFQGLTETSEISTEYPSKSTLSGGVKLADGGVALVNLNENVNFELTGTLVNNAEYQAMFLVSPPTKVSLQGNQSVTPSLVSDDAGGIILTGGTTYTWRIRLPVGTWSLEIFYTNASSTAVSQFPIRVEWYTGTGYQTVTSLPWVFDLEEDELTSVKLPPLVTTGGAQDLRITWTGSVGSLNIREIVFRSEVSADLHYKASFTPAVGAASFVDVVSRPNRYDVLKFRFKATSGGTNTAGVLSLLKNQALPLVVHAFQIQRLRSIRPTPAAGGFEHWKSEMLERTLRELKNSYRDYAETILIDPWDIREDVEYKVIAGKIKYKETEYEADDEFTGVLTDDGEESDFTFEVVESPYQVIEVERPVPEDRVLVDGVYTWTQQSSENWMNILQATDDELKVAFRRAMPGDVGKPALVPAGLEFDSATGLVKATYGFFESVPTIQMLQPWMIKAGIYVAAEDFWSSIDSYGMEELFVPSTSAT